MSSWALRHRSWREHGKLRINSVEDLWYAVKRFFGHDKRSLRMTLLVRFCDYQSCHTSRRRCCDSHLKIHAGNPGPWRWLHRGISIVRRLLSNRGHQDCLWVYSHCAPRIGIICALGCSRTHLIATCDNGWPTSSEILCADFEQTTHQSLFELCINLHCFR